jgi:hypothetical protein
VKPNDPRPMSATAATRATKIDAHANANALETTIKALEGLTPEHTAIVEQARTLARSIDSGIADSKTHGEYRQLLKVLLDVGRKGEVNAFEELLKQLRD